MNRERFKKAKKAKFKNVARDFSVEVLLLGKTKTNNLKIGDIFASGPDGVRYTVRFAKFNPQKNYWMFNTGGSALNSYYLKK